MAAKSLKEKAVLATLGVLVLYAIAIAVWFMVSGGNRGAWSKARDRYQKAVKQFRREEDLIAKKRYWNEKYDSAKAEMPSFALGKATDTTWLDRVEDLAKTNLVLITKIEARDEVSAGDVLELPIEVGSCECSLEALVKFIHALENSTDGMFDVKELHMQPTRGKPGYLHGSISLTCAYMRDKDESGNGASASAKEKK